MTKAEARKLYLQKRQALPDLDKLSRRVIENVLSSGYLDAAKTVHIFLSTTYEPDTKPLLRINKTFIVPKINGSTLEHFYFEGPDHLKPNSFGIMEPVQGIPADIKKIDLVFVPLAIVDVEGNRVGYGKGYYDRFLKECRPDCVKAGLSFFEPVERLEDIEEHDVPLDLCFTPNEKYVFNT